jgi:hypothetical protein
MCTSWHEYLSYVLSFSRLTLNVRYVAIFLLVILLLLLAVALNNLDIRRFMYRESKSLSPLGSSGCAANNFSLYCPVYVGGLNSLQHMLYIL